MFAWCFRIASLLRCFFICYWSLGKNLWCSQSTTLCVSWLRFLNFGTLWRLLRWGSSNMNLSVSRPPWLPLFCNLKFIVLVIATIIHLHTLLGLLVIFNFKNGSIEKLSSDFAFDCQISAKDLRLHETFLTLYSTGYFLIINYLITVDGVRHGYSWYVAL